MKVAVIGSRGLNLDEIELKIQFEMLELDLKTVEIISGGAKGIDQDAKKIAQNLKLKYKEFLPNYKEYGKIAPLLRNEQIIKRADIVLAFWDGKSKGTKHATDKAKKAGKKVIIINKFKEDKMPVQQHLFFC